MTMSKIVFSDEISFTLPKWTSSRIPIYLFSHADMFSEAILEVAYEILTIVFRPFIALCRNRLVDIPVAIVLIVFYRMLSDFFSASYGSTLSLNFTIVTIPESISWKGSDGYFSPRADMDMIMSLYLIRPSPKSL